MSDGILSGIRVVDCGTYIAGPASATIMSDFGAQVFKIERPGGGDLFRQFPHLPGTAKSALNWAWILDNRNKQSVALDLSNPRGRDALIRLVRTADVFVTNYQQELLDKFHLAWSDLRPENERLIYAHLTGYGDSGDDAGAPTFDALAYWARSGLMMMVASPDGVPGSPRPGMGDHPTAMSLFGAIMLGLYQRDRTGRGARVTTSLMASGAWANGCDLQAKFCGAVFPQRGGAAHPPNPLAAAYLSRDGKLFMIALLDPSHEFPRLCEGIGQRELAANPMFSNNAARAENAAALHAILQGEFETRDLAQWREIFARHDVKWSALPPLDDVVRDPQLRAAGAIVEMDYPGHGRLETVNSPIFVGGSEKRAPVAAPEIGSHTRAVLRSIGYGDSEIEELIRAGIAAG